MPKIVVLDGYTLNPGDLSWDGLRALGECEIHDRTPVSEVVSLASEAEILLTNKTPVSKEDIARLSRLKYIGVLATGFNIVDVSAAAERGIPVANVPAYGTASVAQMTWALLLELTQQTGHHAATVREGRWGRSPDFCYWDSPLIELDGLTLGIVGYGRIGQAVARLGRAFGMRILASSSKPGRAPESDVTFVPVDELFSRCDVVSLHCPLTPETRGLVDARRLGLMKRSAFLLNTSRGPLIDEAALAQALTDGRIAGAGLDVLAVEPPAAGSPLIGAPRCFITPHIAWATHGARGRLLSVAVENVRAFLEGKPRNVVN